MKDVQHLIRVVIIFAVALVGFLSVRSLLVPKSFGKLGHYRADSVDEFAAQPRHYAGAEACKKCHAQQVADKAKSSHRGINCESCHGALLGHVENPKSDNKPRRPKETEMRAFCGHCHERTISKPAKYPQINLKEHNPDAPCNMCHQPHQPK
ncbi:MAG: cytochrome c3 family protein [Elusimicrobiales bacterium]|nr:cytochrome c3 family protein [Elusimicrobiales bacterium]